MLSRAFGNADVMSQVIQNLDSVRHLGKLAAVSRSINAAMCKSDTGRKKWLDIGVNTTVGADGFEEDDVRKRFDGVQEQDFFLHLKQLICPWSSQPLFLPYAAEQRGESRKVHFVKGDDEHLVFESGRNVQLIPARPCGACIVQTLDRVPNTVVVRPSQTVRMGELELDVQRKLIVPDFSHDRGNEYSVFSIHAGVFAVVEVLSHEFDVDRLGDHGIYFFAHKDRRFLRHIVWSKYVDLSDCAVLSKPTELWMMGSEGIEYYGIANGPRMVDDICAEFIDPALWMMGRGDAEEAIAYVRDIGASLESSSLVTHRTLLHYAAAEGHVNAIRLLLAAGFVGVDYEDDFSHTALGLAVSNLHLEVVEVLLKEGEASVSAGAFIFTEFGEFVKYRPYATCPRRAELEIDTLIPGIVRLLLDADPEVLQVDEDVNVTNNTSLLSSPEAIRMIMATGYTSQMSWVVTAFMEFRSRAHELSAILSLRVLVREFGLDLNEEEEEYVNTPPLLFLAQFAIAEVTIFAIDILGADPTITGPSGYGIKQHIALRPVGDPESPRLLSYLDTRGY
jgi:hypothetical protein